jgi:hypothetical protein
MNSMQLAKYRSRLLGTWVAAAAFTLIAGCGGGMNDEAANDARESLLARRTVVNPAANASASVTHRPTAANVTDTPDVPAPPTTTVAQTPAVRAQSVEPAVTIATSDVAQISIQRSSQTYTSAQAPVVPDVAQNTATTANSNGTSRSALIQLSSNSAVSSTPVATTAASVAAATQVGPIGNSGLGMNLERPSFWSTDWPLINAFPISGGWATQCWTSEPGCSAFAPGAGESNTREQSKLDLDANGWVRSLPSANDTSVKFRRVWTTLFQGDGGSRMPGKYVVLYDGQGTIEYKASGTKVDAESRPGRDVVAVSNTSDSGLIITIMATNPKDYIRNIRVIGPGGVCASAPLVYVASASSCTTGAYKSLEELSTTQRFHPAFLNDLKGFRTLRFMQWGDTITSNLATWSARPKPTDVFWNTGDGMPYEVMFDLASTAGADPWINVTSYVDDDFVRQLARLAKASTKAPNVVYFEYGNEPWNTADPYGRAGSYYESKAKAKWPGANVNVWQLRMNWYAYRSVQLCNIMKAEFGDQASRVKCVIGGQASSYTVSDWALSCDLARTELGGKCSKFVDALAIGPYFGYYLGSSTHASIVNSWPNEPDGGMDKIFRELTGTDAAGNPVTPPLYSATSGTPKGGAIADAKQWIVDNKKLATAHGVSLVAYESGQHLITYQGGALQKMFTDANRHPRMGAAVARHIEDWKSAGGELFVLYSYVSKPSTSGYWGMKEYQQDDNAPKWLATKAARDKACWWAACAR